MPRAGRGAARRPHPSCQPLRPGSPAGAPGRRPWAEPCFSGKSTGAQATQARPCPRTQASAPRRPWPTGAGLSASDLPPCPLLGAARLRGPRFLRLAGSPVSLLSGGRPSSLVTELGLTPRPLPEPPRPPARRQLPRSQHRAGVRGEARAARRSQPRERRSPWGPERHRASGRRVLYPRRDSGGRRRRHQAAAVSPSQRDTGAAARAWQTWAKTRPCVFSHLCPGIRSARGPPCVYGSPVAGSACQEVTEQASRRPCAWHPPP